MYSNEFLLDEISKKIEVLCRIKDGDRKLRKAIRKCKHVEGLRHSLGLGYPINVDDIKDRKERRKYVQSLKPHLEDIYKAWNYASKNFKLPLEEQLIFELERRIEPHYFNGGPARYRDVGVRLGINTIPTPPYPAKIPGEMQKYFCWMKKMYRTLLKKKKHASFVDLASCAHLHLLRIHPFEDGNGRLARMINNIILLKNDLPPIMIHIGEKVDYHNHLIDAKLGFRDRNKEYCFKREDLSPGEQKFYDYLASKVNMKLDELLKL